MKRWIATLLALLMLVSMVACKSLEEPATDTKAPTETVSPTDAGDDKEQPDASGAGQTEPDQTDPITTDPVESEPLPTEPVPEPDADAFVLITDYIPNAKIKLAYATDNNFTGRQIYAFTDAYLRYGTVKKLMQAAAALEAYGYGIVVWDAYRPVYAQEKLWNIYPDPVYVSKPGTGTQAHSRGIAIDLTLYDLKTGAVLQMPSEMDVFNATSDRNYWDCSAAAAANSKLLESVMTQCGFKPYSEEWWHYSDTVSYDIEYDFDPAGGVRVPDDTVEQVVDYSTCVRDSAEAYFDGVIGTLWYASCNRSMALRSIASTSARSLKTLYANDPLILLGWDGYFAKVASEGTVGYVLCAYIKPADEAYFTEILDVVDFVDTYTYEMMVTDLSEMQQKHPDLVKLDAIGSSEWGTDIPVIRVGSEDAEYHVLIQASIHGCEHISTWVVMAMLDYWLGNGMDDYSDVCYHVIPMANPDGVHTSQTRTLSEEQYQIYLADRAAGYTDLSAGEYAANWKANGTGVDLNRNFPSGWEQITYRAEPSFMLYAGLEPFCSSEAAALRDYTLSYEFDVTLSYHTAGSIIYFEYGKDAAVNARCESLGRAVKKVNGYPLIDSSETDGAGYKDWVIDELKLPSLTIELGWYHPVNAEREQYTLFASQCNVMAAVVDWFRANN